MVVIFFKSKWRCNWYNSNIHSSIPLSSRKRTPNLQGKFILGAGDSFNVNTYGGEKEHVLIRRWTTITYLWIRSGWSHSHGGNTVESDAAHTHQRINNLQNGYTNNGIAALSGQESYFQESLAAFNQDSLSVQNYNTQADSDISVKNYATVVELNSGNSGNARKAINIGNQSVPPHQIVDGGWHTHTITSAGSSAQ